MDIETTAIDGLAFLTPKRFGDNRGFFSESWSAERMRDAGYDIDFVQDNHSMSEQTGTLRGLHFQAPPHAQAKLVRCGRGRLFDVAVDIRRGSPTYGHWIGAELSFDNGKQLLIPEGFLHGFVTLEPMTEIIYKCSHGYAPQADGSVHWDSCGIDWPLTGTPTLSEKDEKAVPLADFDSPFAYQG
ncbi:dTDP-4-dehydrorhamnose 3,5-epimerase [Tropicibacter oceani]|uniref:dTDP-4-dehydrorhamnose 3,5-epimerase n=1 Tax=Tropicibacter oceani TaxID=3058420 RepID=A0ABY8QQF8_9RHOB|nr:dTDP-4-dehydrorhamnose 3,5-epimerase [Tropicibacter oceani]WGW06042.1 dTDP-4-dehydrorhamnose 3,5-epimerase [Tropicibacter oceani]